MSITREMGLNLYRTGILNTLEGLEVQNLLAETAYLLSMRILSYGATKRRTARNKIFLKKFSSGSFSLVTDCVRLKRGAMPLKGRTLRVFKKTNGCQRQHFQEKV